MGAAVGVVVGATEGAAVGAGLGATVGTAVGEAVGANVGASVGAADGAAVGAGVGPGVGHGNVLQPKVSAVAPHATPPCKAFVLMLRVRVFDPPAHSAVQAVQSSQSSSLQSTGQSCVLHSMISCTKVSFTSHVPPCSAGEIVRFRTV